jgi:hypothetical protein
MNDKSKASNPSQRAEEAPRPFSLSEIGVGHIPEAEQQQIVRTADEILAEAQEVLDEAA